LVADGGCNGRPDQANNKTARNVAERARIREGILIAGYPNSHEFGYGRLCWAQFR